MPRPEKPALQGIYRSPDNRFEWNAKKNPSPMRAYKADLQHITEEVPVLCRWCGFPYWPPANVVEGCCSQACITFEQDYLKERSDRERLFDQLRQQEIDNDKLRGLLGRIG